MLAILFSRLNAGLVPEHDVAEESAPVADLNSQGVAGRLEDASIDDCLDYTNGQLTDVSCLFGRSPVVSPFGVLCKLTLSAATAKSPGPVTIGILPYRA